MGDISDSAIVSALRRQMTVAVAKQVASAGNLANLNTPGFKSREVSFDSALDEKLGDVGLAATNSRHLGGTAPSGARTQEATNLPEKRDGNNVQLDRELLTMSRASTDFSAAQTALSAKFRLVRYAIAETK